MIFTEIMSYPFQENNIINKIDDTSYKFKDSYTIKINECRADSFDEDNKRIAIKLPSRDFQLEAFLSMILETIEIKSVDYLCNFTDKNCIWVYFGRDSQIETKSKIKNIKLKYNPFSSAEKFSKILDFDLTVILDFAQFEVKDGHLIFRLDLKTIILKPSNDFNSRSERINIKDIIKKNYWPPIDISGANSKLNHIYHTSKKYNKLIYI